MVHFLSEENRKAFTARILVNSIYSMRKGGGGREKGISRLFEINEVSQNCLCDIVFSFLFKSHSPNLPINSKIIDSIEGTNPSTYDSFFFLK